MHKNLHFAAPCSYVLKKVDINSIMIPLVNHIMYR